MNSLGNWEKKSSEDMEVENDHLLIHKGTSGDNRGNEGVG